jgi:hypothetical protein
VAAPVLAEVSTPLLQPWRLHEQQYYHLQTLPIPALKPRL